VFRTFWPSSLEPRSSEGEFALSESIPVQKAASGNLPSFTPLRPGDTLPPNAML
jgi:hypothetical protein